MEPTRNKIFLNVEEWTQAIEENSDRMFDYYRAYTPQISTHRELLKGLSGKEQRIYSDLQKQDPYYIDNDTYVKYLKIYYTTLAHKAAANFYQGIFNLIEQSLNAYYITKTAPDFSMSTLKFLYPRLSQFFNAFQHLTTVRDWEIKILREECFRRYALNRQKVLTVPYNNRFPPAVVPNDDTRYKNCAITGQYGIKPPVITGNEEKDEGHLIYRNQMVLYSVLIYNLWALYAKLPPWEVTIKPQMRFERGLVTAVNKSFSSNDKERVEGCMQGLRYIISKLGSDRIHVGDIDQITDPDFEEYLGTPGLHDSFLDAPQFNLPSDPATMIQTPILPPVSPVISPISPSLSPSSPSLSPMVVSPPISPTPPSPSQVATTVFASPTSQASTSSPRSPSSRPKPRRQYKPRYPPK